jgi:ribosome-associated translation inhibitor RaiA
MEIQINSDNNTRISEEYNLQLKELLSTKLRRYDKYLTRIELYLSDVNGSKSGIDDKKCLIEARIKGKDPIAATTIEENYDKAIALSLEKLKSSLNSTLGKLKAH